MGQRKMSGLSKRGGLWHIDKKTNGVRIYESTGTGCIIEAEKYLVRRLEATRQATVYGVRPKRTFREATAKFLLENTHKRSLQSDAERLKTLDSYIGNLALESIHMGSLQPYITARKQEGLKTRTINHGLQVIRHILNLAASGWMNMA